MDDLITFLRERLDERERVARAASPGPWSFDGDDEVSEDVDDWTVAYVRGAMKGAQRQEANGEHIADNDPAFVLVDVEAKRQIIAMHKIEVEKIATDPFDPMTGERRTDEYEVTCAVCGWASDDRTSACDTLRWLALLYADHPSFREEWKP